MRFRTALQLQRYAFFLALASFYLALNSFGFDLYHHVLASNSLEDSFSLNREWLILGVSVPRYIFFSYYLCSVSSAGFPPILLIVALQAFIALSIFNGARKNIIGVFLASFVIALSGLFWSPVSMATASIFACFLNRENGFFKYLLFIAMTVHPVGLVLSCFVFAKSRQVYFILVFVMLGLFVHNKLVLPEYMNEFGSVLFREFNSMASLLSVAKSKLKEMLVLSGLLLFLYLAKKMRFKRSLNKGAILVLPIIVCLVCGPLIYYRQSAGEMKGIVSVVFYSKGSPVLLEVLKYGWLGSELPYRAVDIMYLRQ